MEQPADEERERLCDSGGHVSFDLALFFLLDNLKLLALISNVLMESLKQYDCRCRFCAQHLPSGPIPLHPNQDLVGRFGVGGAEIQDRVGTVKHLSAIKVLRGVMTNTVGGQSWKTRPLGFEYRDIPKRRTCVYFSIEIFFFDVKRIMIFSLFPKLIVPRSE